MQFPNNLHEFAALLDSVGFDVGNTRISIYRALLICVVAAGVYIVARFTSGMTRRVFRRMNRLDATEQLLGEKLVGIATWIFCILVGVDVLGLDLTAFAVFSGAFGLAIGFGLQKTFGNLLAGIILLMDRSIKPGDVISVNDGISNTFGQVKRIGLRAVSVTTRDNKEYLIPNENLMINQVENWSFSSREVRISIPVNVAYGAELGLVESLLMQAARETTRVLNDPPAAVRLLELGENGMKFDIRIWIVDPEDGIGNVRSDVLKKVWNLFRENGVQIPHPQRDLHVRSWPEVPTPALQPSNQPLDPR